VLDVVEAAERAGAVASVSSVAEGLHVDQPRASMLVALAVEVGLLRSEADQADGRACPIRRVAGPVRICSRQSCVNWRESRCRSAVMSGNARVLTILAMGIWILAGSVR
jgi:hypothetical protein